MGLNDKSFWIRLIKVIIFVPFLIGWVVGFLSCFLVLPFAYIVYGFDLEDIIDLFHKHYIERFEQWD